MNYLTYGNKQDKAIVLMHGMASTALLCYAPILKYFENAEYANALLSFFSGGK